MSVVRPLDPDRGPPRTRGGPAAAGAALRPEDPTLFGFPFFFWFQFALIPVAVVLTVVAYYLSKAGRSRDRGAKR